MKIFVCDAFSSQIFKGNQAGVVILDEKENYPDEILMKNIAAELKHSETAFVKKIDNKKFKKGIHFEDIQLIPQLLLSCKTIAQTQKYHYQYLERQDSITKTHTEKGLDILRAVEDVEQTFYTSVYSHKLKELKGFQILEGIYSFLAYLAFVKDTSTYQKMSLELKKFIKDRGISRREILGYKRFDTNYILSLPLKKKIYYFLYFFNQERIINFILKKN